MSSYSRSGQQQQPYQDFTRSGITQFEQTDIYKKATRMGDRQVIEDNRPSYPDYQRKTVRNVEVPYKRQVKVPTKETKLVASRTTMKVPVKKLVEVPSFRIMDEEYTEWEDQEKVRDKEIWVKKIVQEKYIEKVPVKKIRQVRVPHKEIKEVQELQDVVVDTNKAIEVPGYRVDEVQDSKIVEVEELENMRWNAAPTGEHALLKTEEGPIVPGDGQGRSKGNEFYSVDDPHVRHLDIDRESTRRPSTAGMERTMRMNDSFYNKASMAATRYVTHNASQPMRPLDEPSTTNGNYGWSTSSQSYGHGQTQPQRNNWVNQVHDYPPRGDPRFHVPSRSAGDLTRTNHRQPNYGGQPRPKSRGLGITCKTTATAHSNSYGVTVTKVKHDSAGAYAGLREKDVIVGCQGRKISSVEELGAAIQSSGGNGVSLIVSRNGGHAEVLVNAH